MNSGRKDIFEDIELSLRDMINRFVESDKIEDSEIKQQKLLELFADIKLGENKILQIVDGLNYNKVDLGQILLHTHKLSILTYEEIWNLTPMVKKDGNYQVVKNRDELSIKGIRQK